MIVSHKYKFIFLKTAKTAGTSIEIALSRFVGDQDIVTPISAADEKIRRSLGYRGPQNFRVPFRRHSAAELCLVALRGRRKSFYNHMTADETRRGKVTFGIGKNYDVLFNGDAIINFAARSNWFLKKFVSVGHSVELVNGLQLENTLEYAQRSSLYDYKLASPWADSLFGKYGLPIFNNVNRPIDFATYGALYNSITLTYTHKQKYIREPRQKIVLGSKYPSIYFTWRKGVSRVLRSEVDFDYIEAGAKKFVNAGTLGTGRFTFKYGNNVNRRDLRVVDYKWMRRGDPFLFFNPETNFQALDSTFAIFRGFAEGHYYHDFNGALINKIPYAKKAKIFEIAGAGVFILPERNIRYVEAYAGLEKQLKLFGEVFKIGGYLVSSFANEKGNPIQYKFRIRHYNNTYNRWE